MAQARERMLLIGGSRGLGAAAAQHLAARGTTLLCVSRTPSAVGQWIEADISTDAGVSAVVSAVGPAPLDALMFLGGVWEEGAFTDAYRFEASGDAENRFVLAVNLIAPIELTRRLAPALAKAANPRAVYIGALMGHDGGALPEVANTASKFGLIGAARAMRAALRGAGIGFTVLNPGNVATEEVIGDIQEGRFVDQTPIPMTDFLAALDCVLAMSAASEVAELNLAQRRPG